MKKFAYLLLALYGLGGIAAIAVPLLAEVNIAEVKGQYREHTVADALDQHRLLSVQYLNLALHEAYLAGYGKAMIDYNIISSTAPATHKDENEEEQPNER